MGLKSFTDAMAEAFNDLTEEQQDSWCEGADGTCSSGSDTDGSSVFEIFENGYELGLQAGDSDVWYVDTDSATKFFIGSEEGLLKSLLAAKGEDQAEA